MRQQKTRLCSHSWCDELHLEEKQPADEAAYQRIVKEVNRKKLELETKQRLNDEDEYEAKRTKERSEGEKETGRG